jgi:hypothetical protein
MYGRTLGSGAEAARRNERPSAMDGMRAVGEARFLGEARWGRATEIGIRATAEPCTKKCGRLH